MLSVNNLPPITVKFFPNTEDDLPLVLRGEEISVLLKRATEDADDLLASLIENASDKKSPKAPPGHERESKEEQNKETLNMELSWDIEDSGMPDSVQKILLELVAAGLIGALKDLLGTIDQND